MTPSSGAGSTTPSPAPTTASDATPAVIPSGPGTPAFLDRAHAVADAVRAAGIPAPPDGLFLVSSRTPGLGFDTGEQKLGWSAGQVTVASGVRLGSGGASQIDFADGSSLPVTVLDAKPALMGVIGSQRSNCRGVPNCRLIVTGGSLGTTQVETSNGPATVPAWSFTAKGLSRKIIVVAVSKDELKPLVEPVPPPGLAELHPGLLRGESFTRVEGSTLSLVLYHGACDRDLQAHVVESDDLVVIGGSHALPVGGCHDIGLSSPATITLAAPLGDRAVISAATGVRLNPPFT